MSNLLVWLTFIIILLLCIACVFYLGITAKENDDYDD